MIPLRQLRHAFVLRKLMADGGLLGRQIKWIEADTKSDQANLSQAGQSTYREGVDMLIVYCDYDFGSPAALAAESEGKILSSYVQKILRQVFKA